MKYLLICNKTDPFIRDLFQALNEKGFESSIFQINGFKLISQKKSKNLNPKTSLNFLKNTPKLKVFWKIFAIKEILHNLQFDHVIFFFYNWTLKLPISSLKKDKKFSFYLDNPIKIDTNILKKSQKIILTSNCDIESFKKLYKKDFSNKTISIPKIVNFDSLTKIKESIKQNRIYCDIQDIDNVEDFVKKIENLEYEFIFPLVGESFERREKIKSILKNSKINYKLFNNFLSLEENFRLILSSKKVIALSNPKYLNIIQLSLFANKIPLVFEKYLCFFSKNKFHFDTINNTNDTTEKLFLNKTENTTNRVKSIEEFSKKAVIEKLTDALEKK